MKYTLRINNYLYSRVENVVGWRWGIAPWFRGYRPSARYWGYKPCINKVKL